MKYFIHTFGCQMNECDSSEMAAALEKEGHTAAVTPEEADIVLVNTCTVREKAAHKGVSAIGRYISMKKNMPHKVVAACGCYVQQAGEALFKEIRGLDIAAGPDAKHTIANLVADRISSRKSVINTCLDGPQHMIDATPRPRSAKGPSEFVTIMKGCDNFCSFCVVPYVRGREFSRAPDDILSEIRELASTGAKEVTLLGQNVNSFNTGDGSSTTGLPLGNCDFPALLDKIFEIEGIERVRFTTSHPKDLSPRLAERFAHPKLMPHIHLPVQAGSNSVLKRMNRKYTREDYLARIEMLRSVKPDIAVSTDLIVGFPGETDDDFNLTMQLISEVGFDSAFSFKYSPRPGTVAACMPDDVPPVEKSRRLALLQDLIQKIAEEKNERLAGATVKVLVEGKGREAGQLSGRTPCNRIVNFSGEKCRTGDIVKVQIMKAMPHSLFGREA